jgi:hypothetical protein
MHINWTEKGWKQKYRVREVVLAVTGWIRNPNYSGFAENFIRTRNEEILILDIDLIHSHEQLYHQVLNDYSRYET